MNNRLKREKRLNERVVKEEFVPVIIQEDANTFAAYTLQTFTEEEEEDAITVETLNVQEHHNGIPITQIINSEEYDNSQEEQQLEETEEEEQVVDEEEEEEEEEEDEEEGLEENSQQMHDGKDVSPNASNSSYDIGSFVAPPEQARSKTFYCPNCGNCYSAAGSLKLHIRACMRSKDETPEVESSRKCEICNKVFNSSSYLKEHMLRHTGKGPRKCPKCYRKFIDDDKYVAHMETHKLQEKLGVVDSDGSLSAGGSSAAAKKVVKEYVCSFCSKKFTVVFDSRQTKRRYACDECREKYSNEEMLKQHKAALEEKREFHCEKCGRKFIFEGFLQRHLPTCDGTIKRRRDRV